MSRRSLEADRLLKAPCARCGVRTFAEFCRDCKAVDPEMTAAARTSKQMAEVRLAGLRSHQQLVAEVNRVIDRRTPAERTGRRSRRGVAA